MISFTHTCIAVLLAVPALATPLQTRGFWNDSEQIILQIMPESKSCDGSNNQCRTNVQAAPFIVEAFKRYELKTPAEFAAILTTVATESVSMKYKKNQSPGRPGQGTSNMQMFNFNYEFAQNVSELKEIVDEITVAETPEDESDATKNQILDLLIDDKYNWMTGPWYYVNKCSEEQKQALRSSRGEQLDRAFEAYTRDCIGVKEIEPVRMEAWARAKKALGLTS